MQPGLAPPGPVRLVWPGLAPTRPRSGLAKASLTWHGLPGLPKEKLEPRAMPCARSSQNHDAQSFSPPPKSGCVGARTAPEASPCALRTSWSASNPPTCGPPRTQQHRTQASDAMGQKQLAACANQATRGFGAATAVVLTGPSGLSGCSFPLQHSSLVHALGAPACAAVGPD